MNITKTVYISLLFAFLFIGCTQSEKSKESEKMNQEVEVKKETVPSISVSEKKERFKEILVPITIEIYNELEEQYQTIKLDIENDTNLELIDKLKAEYNADSNETLLHALKPHPISIALAQAAAESAWLTSRFAKEANNIFGVWSFNVNEPRIAASGLRGDKTIYLKKYDTVKEAVRDYYKNLGKTWAYSEFRKQRTLTTDPYILSDHLSSYSEKKEVYTELLKSMIKYNEFEQYDINTIKITEPVSTDHIDIEVNTAINIDNEIETNLDQDLNGEENEELDPSVEETIDDETELEVETETTSNIDSDTNMIIEEQ